MLAPSQSTKLYIHVHPCRSPASLLLDENGHVTFKFQAQDTHTGSHHGTANVQGSLEYRLK